MICTENIDTLVPDSIMDSGHFHLVILDVEGRILKCNRNFESFTPQSEGMKFWNFLSVNTAEEFCYSLELMLSAPKIRRNLLLEHATALEGSFSQIWWEFSVITNPEMDISAIIGIGVGLHFLEQEMPWNNLADVLGFGKISLDLNLRILDLDSRVNSWFGPAVNSWKGKALMQTTEFGDDPALIDALHIVLDETKPHCFVLHSKGQIPQDFACLLAPTREGYHLFLGPKECKEVIKKPVRIFPERELNLIQGSILVLDSKGSVIQQNKGAKSLLLELSQIGIDLINCFHLTKVDPKLYKVQKAFENAIGGIHSNFELKVLFHSQSVRTWEVSVKPIVDGRSNLEGVVLHFLETSLWKQQMTSLQQENESLRELAAQPSHVLRGPLSSMMGILELINYKDLSEDNKKLISYLKPLANEIDQKIRAHAKRMSS